MAVHPLWGHTRLLLRCHPAITVKRFCSCTTVDAVPALLVWPFCVFPARNVFTYFIWQGVEGIGCRAARRSSRTAVTGRRDRLRLPRGADAIWEAGDSKLGWEAVQACANGFTGIFPRRMTSKRSSSLNREMTFA